MKLEQQLQIQELVLNYFESTDDLDVALVINSFVYENKSPNTKISKLIEKFLADNGLTQAFINLSIDKANPDRLFSRSSGSESDMIEQVKIALLNLSFNRFLKYTRTIKPVVKVVKTVKILPKNVKLTYDGDSNIHVISHNDNYTICGNLIDGDEVLSIKYVSDKVNCPHCLELIKICKTQ